MTLSNPRNRSIKKPLVIVAFLLVVAASGIGYLAYSKVGIFSEPMPDTEADAVNKPLSDRDLGVEKSKASDPTSNSAKTNDTSPDSVADDSLEITSTSVNGEEFVIRTLLTKITATGQCTLSMQNGSQIYTATAGAQPAATSSTCKGFDVPLSELSSGKWNITVSYSDGTTALKTSKEVDINA